MRASFAAPSSGGGQASSSSSSNAIALYWSLADRRFVVPCLGCEGCDAKATAKVEAARERLGADCETFHARLDTSNASALFGRADFIIDATDDPETKWLINRTALATGKPYCHAGVVGGRGQLMAVVPGRSACLECVFGSFGDLTGNAGCAELGVLAPVAGLIGTLEALTATAYLTGDQAFRAGRMLTYELPAGRWRHVDFERVDGCVCRHRRQ